MHQKAAGIVNVTLRLCSSLQFIIAVFTHGESAAQNLKLLSEGENTKGIAMTREDFSWTKAPTFQHRIPAGFKGATPRE